MTTFDPVLLDDLDLLAGLAAERLLDIQRQGTVATHRQMAKAAKTSHDRINAALVALRDKAMAEQNATAQPAEPPKE